MYFVIFRWIDEKTHGRIKDIIAPPVSPLTKVIFAGAMYFNGDWEYPFSEKITKWYVFVNFENILRRQLASQW